MTFSRSLGSKNPTNLEVCNFFLLEQLRHVVYEVQTKCIFCTNFLSTHHINSFVMSLKEIQEKSVKRANMTISNIK